MTQKIFHQVKTMMMMTKIKIKTKTKIKMMNNKVLCKRSTDTDIEATMVETVCQTLPKRLLLIPILTACMVATMVEATTLKWPRDVTIPMEATVIIHTEP